MFPKLTDAIRKAAKRIAGREADVDQATDHAHQLTAEIRELKQRFDKLAASHAETLQEIAEEEARGKPRKGRLETLRPRAKHEAEELRHIVERIRHKRGKRNDWRDRARIQRKKARWWIARRTTLRGKLKAAKKKYAETHKAPVFETWMLNGCPNITNGPLKEVIAFVVVECDQYVTATTNGTHTTGSYHYSERAADWGAGSVSSMQSAAERTRKQFGDGHFLEFFSPCDWWIKYGAVYPGYFPGHGDHGHTAVEK